MWYHMFIFLFVRPINMARSLARSLDAMHGSGFGNDDGWSVGRASRFADFPISNVQGSFLWDSGLESKTGLRRTQSSLVLILSVYHLFPLYPCSPCRYSLPILSPSFTAMDRFSFAPHLQTHIVRSPCICDQRERARWRVGYSVFDHAKE